MYDIHPNFQKRVKDFIKYFRKKLPEYDQLLTGNIILQERTKVLVYYHLKMLFPMALQVLQAELQDFACDVESMILTVLIRKVDFKEIFIHEGDTFMQIYGKNG